MTHLLVRQKVKNYDEWKTAFDAHSDFRQTHASLGGHLFANATDPNEIFILFEWDDLEKARKLPIDVTKIFNEIGANGCPLVNFG